MILIRFVCVCLLEISLLFCQLEGTSWCLHVAYSIYKCKYFYFCLFVCLFVFWRHVFLCSSSFPGTWYIDQAALELREIHPPLLPKYHYLKCELLLPGSFSHFLVKIHQVLYCIFGFFN